MCNGGEGGYDRTIINRNPATSVPTTNCEREKSSYLEFFPMTVQYEGSNMAWNTGELGLERNWEARYRTTSVSRQTLNSTDSFVPSKKIKIYLPATPGSVNRINTEARRNDAQRYKRRVTSCRSYGNRETRYGKHRFSLVSISERRETKERERERFGRREIFARITRRMERKKKDGTSKGGPG